MQDWEKALEEFLEPWKKKKEVVGAIVCGSYITGNPSPHSDIDIHIILDKQTKWRERGNVMIDGILIEYFANTKKRHKGYAETDYKQRKRINAHMFATGKILFDNTGEVKELVKQSKKQMKKMFPKMKKFQVELAKYHLWDMNDNLEEIYDKKGKEFDFVYHNCLFSLLNTYAEFLRQESYPIHKVLRFLKNKNDQKKYDVKTFPDKTFVNKYSKAILLTQRKEKMKYHQELSHYVLEKMSGFSIDGWKLRSEEGWRHKTKE